MSSKKKDEESSSGEEESETSEDGSTESDGSGSSEGSGTSDGDTSSGEEEAPPPKKGAGSGKKEPAAKEPAGKKEPAKKEPAKAAAKKEPAKKEPAKKSSNGDGKGGSKKGKSGPQTKKAVRKNVELTVGLPAGPFFAGNSVTVHVTINNDSPKQIKSIEAHVRVFKGKTKKSGGKIKRPKPKALEGSEQEFFQGARFPLQGNISYEGEISYPIPKKLEATNAELEYELVVSIAISGIKWKTLPVYLALPITSG